jgi:hypothetical protein
LGAGLAEGLRVLSVDQQITFVLYRRYVFPLDGTVYWIKQTNDIKGDDAVVQPGRAYEVYRSGVSVQAVGGNLDAPGIVGGTITNPASATESLFVSLNGPTRPDSVTGAIELLPGESFDIPPAPLQGVFVNAATGPHPFDVEVLESQEPFTDLPATLSVPGSLHYSSTTEQREDMVVDTNTIVFSALSEIQEFNRLSPEYIYVGTYRGERFAFASRGMFYEQADLFHYMGQSLNNVNFTQVIEDAAAFEPVLVNSNSLPVWLQLNGYISPYGGFECNIPIYPAYLIPDNLTPPFVSVRVLSTRALQAVASWGPRMQHDQLTADRVRLTFFGASNEAIMDFTDFVIQYMRDWGLIGLMNGPLPIATDEYREQPEFKILAQKTTVEYEVSYLQSQVRDLARQFILGAKVQYVPSSLGIVAPRGPVYTRPENSAGASPSTGA